MVCSLTADTFIARYKKTPLVYFAPHQPPQLPDHPPLVKAQNFTMYLLSFDLALLPLLYLKWPHVSLVPPHSVYRRPEPASLCSLPCLNFIPLLQWGLSCLAAASLLPWPLLQSSPPLSLSCLLLSHIHPLRCAGCLSPYFIVRRLRLGFLQAFPASQRGQEKKIAWDFLVTWEEEEEVPRPSPAGRSPLHPGFQGRAANGAPVQWLMHVPLSPAACRWTGRK